MASSRRQRLLALPACLAVTAGLAACGGKALSKDEYVKQANAICNDVKSKGKKLGAPKSVADVAAFTDKAKPLLEGQAKRLRDLQPPKELKKQTASAYDSLDKQIGKLDDLKAAAKSGDAKKLEAAANGLPDEFGPKAQALGLTDCN